MGTGAAGPEHLHLPPSCQPIFPERPRRHLDRQVRAPPRGRLSGGSGCLAELPAQPGPNLMLIGAVLFSAAAYCLLVALAPPPFHSRTVKSGLPFIRSSTADQPPAPPTEVALLHGVLRRLTGRLGVRARGITAQDLVEAGIDPESLTPAEVTTLKLLFAAAAAAPALVLTSVLPGLLLLMPAAAWIAFVAPSISCSLRRSRRRAIILGELPDVVGVLRAFTNAQVPLEQALHLVSRQLADADPDNLLAAERRHALGHYRLGETIDVSL